MKPLLLPLLAVLLCAAPSLGQGVNPTAPYSFALVKTAGLEMSDGRWFHLHDGMVDAQTFGIAATTIDICGNAVSLDVSAIQIRYMARAVPLTGWLSAPFTATIDAHAPELAPLLDGFHDLSVEVRGPDANLYRPFRSFLHLSRHGAIEPSVPIISTEDENCVDSGPGVTYANVAERIVKAYPADPSTEPWHTEPAATGNLWQEPMQPHAGLFRAAQFVWEEPQGTVNAGLKFIRALPPKLYRNDDFRVLFEGQDNQVRKLPHDQTGYGGLKNFPYKDGGRGIGWPSAYIQGVVDSTGGLAFVEIGGPIRYMEANGELHTVAGWRVKSDRDPVWILKSFDSIRQNMELRGVWPDTLSGFSTPMDVAIDPRNETKWFVASHGDNGVFTVSVDRATWTGTVTPFAQGFNGPTSLAFDAVCDCLYVVDQGNKAIKKVTRAGVVSTVLSDLPKPFWIRTDSVGRLIVLDEQTADVTRYDLTAGTSKRLGGAPITPNGWAMLDVDKTGNSGPKDGVFLIGSKCDRIDGDPRPNVNECASWIPPDGGPQQYLVVPPGTGDLNGFGPVGATHAPHYGWLIAVDPRGGLYLTGIGEHGITRIRKARATDLAFSFQRYLDVYDWVWRYGCATFKGGHETLTPDCTGSDASLSFKHGWDGHNYLGFADAWGITNSTTDADILRAFDVPATSQNATGIVHFLKANAGISQSVVVPPSPVPPPTPQPPAGQTLYVLGTDNWFYRWNGAAWLLAGSSRPSGVCVEGPTVTTADGAVWTFAARFVQRDGVAVGGLGSVYLIAGQCAPVPPPVPVPPTPIPPPAPITTNCTFTLSADKLKIETVKCE